MKERKLTHPAPPRSGAVIACALALSAANYTLQAQPAPGTVLWSYSAASPIQNAPALAPDGTVYIVASGLFAVTNSVGTGSNKWVFGSAPLGEATVGADGTIYFCTGPATYAVNPDGSQKWSVSARNSAFGNVLSPAIGKDGTVYVATANDVGSVLQAISSLGVLKWQWTNSAGPALGSVLSPVIAPDGTIYVGFGSVVCAVSPQGSNLWTAPNTGWAPGGSLAIGGDGTVLAGGNGLCAFSPAGVGSWSAPVSGSPVIGKDGSVYVVSGIGPGFLTALSPSGQISWQAGRVQYETNMNGYCSAAVDAGGTIYYCTSNSVWAVSPQGQVQWKVTSSGPQGYEQSPIIGPDGTLYAALGPRLYAIATGTTGPANSPWPMERQNARHTGKVERPTLGQPQRRSDANFQFQLYGQLGQTYTIQSSTDLAAWTSFTSIVATTLPTPVADLTATNAPWRLYRASSPP